MDWGRGGGRYAFLLHAVLIFDSFSGMYLGGLFLLLHTRSRVSHHPQAAWFFPGVDICLMISTFSCNYLLLDLGFAGFFPLRVYVCGVFTSIEMSFHSPPPKINPFFDHCRPS